MTQNPNGKPFSRGGDRMNYGLSTRVEREVSRQLCPEVRLPSTPPPVRAIVLFRNNNNYNVMLSQVHCFSDVHRLTRIDR